MTDLSSRQIPKKAGELVDHLRDSAQHIHQLTSDISKPDQAGMSRWRKHPASLINANAATANLADVTEAAKHNFLLRGFFNKRGYYSLADISPERYRRDGAFTKRSNRRIWLSGSELFQNGSNGEELSERGKAVLHAALTQDGESLAGRAIVIEGYANGGIPADQLPDLSESCDGGPAICPGRARARSKESRSRADEQRAAEGTRACDMGRRVHRSVAGKLRMQRRT